MADPTPTDDPDARERTRTVLHAVAEQVMAAARHRATGRIGLAPAEGGFATPPFDGPHGRTVIAVTGIDLVVSDDRGTRQAPLTTLADAGALVDIEPGAPADVYTPETDVAPDAPLDPDPAVAAELADAFAAGGAALARLIEQAAADGVDAAEVTLWPEHFDVATTIDEVNFGVSPGDGHEARPYAYVGPWTPRRGDFWNAPFGAARPLAELGGVDEVTAFFSEGRQRAADDPVA